MGGFTDGGGTLTIAIGADPTAAMQALAGLQQQGLLTVQQMNTGIGQAGGGVRQFDENILSANQSVRLLSAELGLHLPRAVMGAIAEMLPQISNLGNVLLGVFAVQSIIQFIRYIKLAADEANLLAQAQKQFTEAVKESDKAIESLGKRSRELAQAELIRLGRQIVAQQDLVDRLKDEAENRDKYLGLATNVYDKLMGKTKELQKAEEALQHLEELRRALATSLGEGEVERHEKAAEAANKQVKAQEALIRGHNEWVASLQRGNPMLMAFVENLEKAAADEQKLKDLKLEAELGMQTNFVRNLNTSYDQLIGTLQTLRLLGPSVLVTFKTIEATIAPEISAVNRLRNAFLGLTMAGREFSRAQIESMMQAGDITEEQADRMVAGLEREKEAQVTATIQSGITVVAMIAGRRAAAAIEAIWETAQGYADLASFNYWSAALHFLSAAQYGLIAGGVGEGGGGRGGGGGEPHSLASAGARGAPPGLAAGSVARTEPTRLNVIVMGESNTAFHLKRILDRASTTQSMRLSAGRSKLPTYAGR